MRIGGLVLILGGAATLVGLLSLFYAPIPRVSDILVSLGMPGVLLGALIGILCLGAGVMLVFADLRQRQAAVGRGGQTRVED